jgi:hypothetical protein
VSTAIKDDAALNAEACLHLDDMLPRIIGWKGRPSADVAALAPAGSQPRRLSEWRVYPDGSWRALSGNPGQGRDLISLIAHLADVERPVAAELLANFVTYQRIARRVA